MIDVLPWLAAIAVALPASVFCAEVLLALLPARRSPATAARPRLAVVVPAHDEAAAIAGTVAHLRAEIDVDAGDRLLVVADNCGDDTAARARDAGAEVVERRDPDRRGKGFALAFAFAHIDATGAPDVVGIVDADCRVSAGGLARLGAVAQALDRPVQADYLLRAPPGAGARAAISQFAFLVRNRVRPLGLKRVGVPCHLMGSGMAVPWLVLRKAPPYGDNLVEDLAMGIDLALAGHPPYLCQEVRVTSALPSGQGSALAQRRRWEHGHLATLVRHVPRLVRGALVRGRLGLLVQALDLAVPPLALLVAVVVLAAGLTGAATLLGAGAGPLWLATGTFFALGACVLLAWARFARAEIPARALLAIGAYVLWKLPLYLALLVGRRERKWVRTERDGSTPAPTRSAPGGS